MTTKRLVLIIVTFLVVSAVASPLLSLLQEATGADPEVLRLPTFATAVGAVVVWLVWRKTFTFPRQPGGSVFLVIVLSVLFAVATSMVLFALNAVEGNVWPPLDPASLPASLAVVLFLQLLGAVGEEVGWRGVVQPLLENRFSVVRSGVITGLLFGLGHFYVLFAGPVVYATFVVAAIGLSVTLAVLTVGRSLASRVLVASFFHWLVNSAMLVFFSGGDESLLWTANTAIATVVVAIVAVLLHRRAGQKRPPQESSSDEMGGTGSEPASSFQG